eukprot:jgi/Mesen1/6487/ME000331S05608
MQVVRVALAVQNAAVVAACLAVAWLLAHQPGEPASWLVVTVLLSLTGVEGLATLATDVAIQRDWVVVVAEESPHGAGGGARLAQINASMRQIDLTCKLVAPAVAGLLVGATSPATAALLIATWNVASGLAEVPPGGSLSVAERPEMYLARDELEGRWRASAFGPLMRQVALQVADSGAGMVAGWRVYLRQEALLAAVSLALLYLTVLSFDALMTASLMWRGVPTVLLGAVRGVAALTGLVGTLVYPVLRDHIGTVRRYVSNATSAVPRQQCHVILPSLAPLR